MYKHSARNVDFKRAAFSAILVMAVAIASCWIARMAPATPAGHGIALLIGCLMVPVVGSFLEWFVHRHVYHRRLPGILRRIFEIHHRGHHFAVFPPTRYVSAGFARRHAILSGDVSHLHASRCKNGLTRLAHIGFYLMIGAAVIWTPAWMFTHNRAFLAGIIVVSVILSDMFVRVHDAIHHPGLHPFIEARPWFKFLDRHHYIHHVDTEANVNFLLPLADWLLGTMRCSLSSAELERYGPVEQAKKSTTSQAVES